MTIHGDNSIVLAFEHVSFAYGKDGVLEDASFAVRAGEMVALVGNNGSGKSTVAKLAEGFVLPSQGTVKVLERSVKDVADSQGADGLLALRSNLGLVMQNPDDQLVASCVVDEVAFGPSNLGLPRDEVVARVQEALDAVGMAAHAGDNVNTLSGGQKQRIAMADALAMRPKLLVMDEPTSMLDAQGRQDVRAIACALRDEGASVLWITHAPEEAALADRVLAVEEGRIVETCDTVLSGSDNTLASTRRRLELTRASAARVDFSAPLAFNSARACPAPTAQQSCVGDSGGTLIEFREASFAYSGENELGIDIFSQPKGERLVFAGVNLQVRAGETLAVIGPNGCGKSTLLQNMNGLLKPTSGEVLVCGQATSSKEGANAARRAVGLCMQYPERSLFSQTVRDEVAFGLAHLGLDAEEVDARVQCAMRTMELDYDAYAKRVPFDLSGGEQRKVALASIVAMRPKVLVLDEPCSSLDVPSHRALIEALLEMKDAGQTMVLVTHDERDVDLLADRVFEMSP